MNKLHLFCYLSFFSLTCIEQTIASETDNWLDKIHLSGYTKLLATAKNNKPTEFEIDDLSIFISGKFNRWLNPFLEAEASAIPVWKESQGIQLNSTQLIIERLYNDIEITDTDTFRAGKFLAPINHWNIIHAAPLVWTTTRPITSTYSQANYITGFSERHDFDALAGHALEIYWQPLEEFNAKSLSVHERHYQSVSGFRWILHEDLNYYYGIAIQHADVKDSDELRNSISVDGNWQHEWFELESQFLFTHVDTSQKLSHGSDWGGYLQVVVPVVNHFNVISRYEHFEYANKMESTNSGLAGVVYRPVPSLSFKIEWQQTSGSAFHNETGLYSSIAVLF